jgi:hypothetical protein
MIPKEAEKDLGSPDLVKPDCWNITVGRFSFAFTLFIRRASLIIYTLIYLPPGKSAYNSTFSKSGRPPFKIQGRQYSAYIDTKPKNERLNDLPKSKNESINVNELFLKSAAQLEHGWNKSVAQLEHGWNKTITELPDQLNLVWKTTLSTIDKLPEATSK